MAFISYIMIFGVLFLLQIAPLFGAPSLNSYKLEPQNLITSKQSNVSVREHNTEQTPHNESIIDEYLKNSLGYPSWDPPNDNSTQEALHSPRNSDNKTPGGKSIVCYNYSSKDCESAKEKYNTTETSDLMECQISQANCTNFCERIEQVVNDTRTLVSASCGDDWSQSTVASTNKCYHGTRRLLGNGDILICSCGSDLCNDRIFYDPTAKPKEKIPPDESRKGHSKYSATEALLILPVLAIIIAFIMVIFVVKQKMGLFTKSDARLIDDGSPQSSSFESDSISLSSREDDWLPELLVETGKDQMTPLVRGHFGTICLLSGLYKGEKCVVKISDGNSKACWQQETRIYAHPGIEHENILRFMGSFHRDDKFYIVLEYHSNGSLYDYLKANTVSWEEMLHICYTMMRGLSHLHDYCVVDKKNDPQSRRTKYPIAHRDVKSKNIILDTRLNSKIADFNLAQVLESSEIKGEPMRRVGTNRYMAPEMLLGEMRWVREAFLQTDIYAASLVLWEVFSRWHGNGNTQADYRQPYEDEVGSNPTIDEMTSVVVTKKIRPKLVCTQPGEEFLAAKITEITDTIQSGWEEEPEQRLTAACIELRLKELMTPTNNEHSTQVIRARADNIINRYNLIQQCTLRDEMTVVDNDDYVIHYV